MAHKRTIRTKKTAIPFNGSNETAVQVEIKTMVNIPMMIFFFI